MADTTLPKLEACGRYVRVARTNEDPEGWLVAEVVLPSADCTRLAAVFAAAPDLLAQLKDAVRDLEHSGYCFDHPALVKHRAAIAKAEGAA